MDYAQAAQILGARESRVIMNNTKLVRIAGTDAISIQLYAHPIIVFFPEGRIRLSSCGQRTRTTQARFNKYLPREIGVYTRRGKGWWVYRRGTYWMPFDDGMVLYAQDLQIESPVPVSDPPAPEGFTMELEVLAQ